MLILFFIYCSDREVRSTSAIGELGSCLERAYMHANICPNTTNCNSVVTEIIFPRHVASLYAKICLLLHNQASLPLYAKIFLLLHTQASLPLYAKTFLLLHTQASLPSTNDIFRKKRKLSFLKKNLNMHKTFKPCMVCK